MPTPIKTTSGQPTSQVIASGGAGHGSTATGVRRWTTHTTTGSGITSSGNDTVNGTTFTINESGVYAMTYVDRYSAGGTMLAITLNSNQLTTAPDSMTASLVLAECFFSTTNQRVCLTVAAVRLSAGDVIRAQTDGNPNEVTYGKFIITQIARF